MTRYLSLLGLLFLGVGAIALSALAKEPVHKLPPGSSDDFSRSECDRTAVSAIPSFHARFSLN
jgi:hypothetical protein